MVRLLIALILAISSNAIAQYTIPDAAFAAKLQQLVPNAMSGNVLDTNHVDVLSATSLSVGGAGISDLSGIRFFISLEELFSNYNQLTSLPSLPNSLKILIARAIR